MIEQLGNLLNGGSIVALPVALIAGLLAGLNPCCLSLYPLAAGCCTALRRETVRGNLGIAAAFVVGVSLMATLLGIVSSLAGSALAGLGSWPAYLVAVIPIAFGLHLMGAISLPLPRGVNLRRTPKGPLGALAAGALLGLVVTPCSTPVLAGLLAYVATTGNPAWGGLLLFVYGVGLGLPVLFLGTAAASLVSRFSGEKARRWVEPVTGAILICVGLYLLWIA